ncbi:MAG: hypothetical protein ACYC6Y_12020 [Thermoguttaceae bacterium]
MKKYAILVLCTLVLPQEDAAGALVNSGDQAGVASRQWTVSRPNRMRDLGVTDSAGEPDWACTLEERDSWPSWDGNQGRGNGKLEPSLPAAWFNNDRHLGLWQNHAPPPVGCPSGSIGIGKHHKAHPATGTPPAADSPTTLVPEPTSMAVWGGLGLIGLIALGRKRRPRGL